MYEWQAANAPYRDVEFNLMRPFLSDVRVREALARALNREDLRDVAEQGLASPAYSFIAQTNTKWLNSNVERFDFDLDQSRSLLAQAGYTLENGKLLGSDGQPVRLAVYYPTSSAPRARIATYSSSSSTASWVSRSISAAGLQCVHRPGPDEEGLRPRHRHLGWAQSIRTRTPGRNAVLNWSVAR